MVRFGRIVVVIFLLCFIGVFLVMCFRMLICFVI